MSILFAIACGGFDWLRGNKDPKAVFMLLYGLCVSAIALNDPTSIFIMGVCFAIGSAPGWSDAYGAIIHDRPMSQDRPLWWCIGPLRTNAYASQAVRALIWAFPCLIASIFIGGAEVGLSIALAHLISLPLAVRIPQDKLHPWKLSEILRGVIVGLLVTLA